MRHQYVFERKSTHLFVLTVSCIVSDNSMFTGRAEVKALVEEHSGSCSSEICVAESTAHATPPQTKQMCGNKLVVHMSLSKVYHPSEGVCLPDCLVKVQDKRVCDSKGSIAGKTMSATKHGPLFVSS